MFGNLAKQLFGTANDRVLKSFEKTVAAINDLEPGLEALDDDALRARTDALRSRLAAGETLEDILPDAFATVREAAKRTLGQRHFDVQLMGGMVLNDGRIAEMKTGEGKTLVATLAVYLNALTGRGVHVVTVKPGFVRTRMTEDMSLPSRLTATPDQVAHAVYRAVVYHQNVIYVKPMWRPIMLIIRLLPEFFFKQIRI